MRRAPNGKLQFVLNKELQRQERKWTLKEEWALLRYGVRDSAGFTCLGIQWNLSNPEWLGLCEKGGFYSLEISKGQLCLVPSNFSLIWRGFFFVLCPEHGESTKRAYSVRL